MCLTHLCSTTSRLSLASARQQVLNTIRFSVAHCDNQNPHHNKVIIVLAPSRELGHDLGQDVIDPGVFQSGRWRSPAGRSDGLWDDALVARVKERQARIRQQLDEIKDTLKPALDVLNAVDRPLSCAWGPCWNYATDNYLHTVEPECTPC
jgi:hypothetical protein